MKKLLEIGFIKVGEWSLGNGFHHTITTRLNQRNLLYSFTCDSSLLYIGKTTDTLKSRMNGYKNAGSSQKTNIRVKGKIIEILQKKKIVDIYVLIDNAGLKYKQYQISLAGGLEDNLIARLRPKWNFIGNNQIKVQDMPVEGRNILIENIHAEYKFFNIVVVKMSKTYWHRGYINLSIKDSFFLSKEPINVTLLLGENADFCITGRFIFATKNKQPRILGNNSLKDWFQNKYEIGDMIKVDIIQPNLFRIN